MAKKMKAMQVTKAQAPFELVERDVPSPVRASFESRWRRAASATRTRS
jgi:hypothetical protein